MKIGKAINLSWRTTKKILHIPEKTPLFASISFTNHCNLSCKMCARNYIGPEIRHMEWSDFTTIVDKLNGVRQISLAGLGESLMHPKFFDAVAYCKAKGIEAQLTTNGLLLSKPGMVEKLVDSGLDTVSFSIESIRDNHEMGHSNKEVIYCIERLLEAKRKLNSETPAVVLQPILFKDKVEDIFEIIKWGAEKGVTRINVIRADLKYLDNVERPDENEEKEIFREFARLRKKYKIRVDCIADQVFEGLPGLIYKHFKYLLRMDTWCYMFHDYIYIDVNGNVHPCCLAKEGIMGNLLKQDLADIWHGPPFNHLRKNPHKAPFCKRCDSLRIEQTAQLKQEKR